MIQHQHTYQDSKTCLLANLEPCPDLNAQPGHDILPLLYVCVRVVLLIGAWLLHQPWTFCIGPHALGLKVSYF